MMKKVKIGMICLLACTFAIDVPKMIILAANDSNAVYSKEYTIENLLSDYQYVSRTDLNVANHTVGAIACGGNATVSNFGDGAIASSYFHNIEMAGNYASGSYFTGSSEYGGYAGLPAYYKNAGTGVLTNGLTQYTGTGEYIDFNNAFTNISNESLSLTTAPDAYIVTTADISGDQYSGYTLDLPSFADYKNVVIPKAVYDKVNYIKLGSFTSAEDARNYQYTISVVGITDQEPIKMTFGYISPADSLSSNTTGILVPNGETFNNSNSFKFLPGGIEAGQMNMSGMKLVWNFPDATLVTTDYTGGHIVAPSATVSVNQGAGNFEGGIIANKIIDHSAEGHFYPYDSVKPTTISPSASPSTSLNPSPSTSPSASPSASPCASPNASPSASPNASPSASPNASPSASTSASLSMSLKEETPKTADNTPSAWLFIVSLILAITSGAATLYFKKKKNI